MKNVMIELLVDNKKDLSVAENKLFSIVKCLGNSFGDATNTLDGGFLDDLMKRKEEIEAYILSLHVIMNS